MNILTVDDAIDFISDLIYRAELPRDYEFLKKLEQAQYIYNEKMSETDKFLLNHECIENNCTNLEDYFDHFFKFLLYEEKLEERDINSSILEKLRSKLTLKLEAFLEGKQDLSLEQIEAYKLLYQIRKDEVIEPEVEQFKFLYEVEKLNNEKK